VQSLRSNRLSTASVLRELGVAFRAPTVAPDRHPTSEDDLLSVRLSWDSSSCVIPSSDMPAARPLPDDIAATVRPVAAKRPTRSALVVSHHLDGLLRAPDLEFIAPRNRIGFAAFPELATTRADRSRRPMVTILLSRNAVHTLRRIPLASSRTASLRPLPSCCHVACQPFRTPKCSTRPGPRSDKPSQPSPLLQPKPLERSNRAVRAVPLTGHPLRRSDWAGPVALCLPAPPKGPGPVMPSVRRSVQM